MFHREAGVFKTSYAADMALYPLPVAQWSMAVIAALFIVAAPMLLGEYYLSVLNLILIAIVGALGLNILVGYTGQISIGHGAFMSVGAYTAANLITRLGMPFWVAIPAAGLMAALIGTIVGIPSLRIKGIYLAIATLAAQLIIEWTINHVQWISGGVQASITIPRPSIFGYRLTTERSFYLFLMAFVVLATVGALNLVRSRIGRAFVAIRDQDIAAEIIGIDIFPLQALRLCDLVLLCRGGGRARKLLSGHRQLRAVPDRRVDRLSGDGHHRRPRLGAGLDVRRGVRHLAADRDPLVPECVWRHHLFPG